MPNSPEAAFEEVRGLCRTHRYELAESRLNEALRKWPAHPDLAAELGLLYSLTQREVEACELLEPASSAQSFATLAHTLAEHFACRQTMAAKLGIRDPLGESLLTRIEDVAGTQEVNRDISIAACLIVRNEEHHLERCLSSISQLVDQIVVVDTGSTDGTVEIAQRYGATLGSFAWCDDYAAARNESLRLATTRWVLWIDADEELAPESMNPIREGLMRPQFAGYFLRIVNFMSAEGEASQYVHSPLRIFQLLPGAQFAGRIHEQILPSLAPHGLPAATLENATLLHHGYRPAEMARKGKVDRTLDMLRKEVAEKPHDPFHWFNLANAHLVARDFPQAAECARECAKLLPAENSYGSVVYQILQTSLIELGRHDEALAAYEECRRRGFATLLNEFEKAHALSKAGRLEEALAQIDRCMQMTWPEGQAGDYGIATHKRHLLRGQILAQLGRLDDAIEMLEHALAHDPNNEVAIYSKAAVLEARGQTEEALSLFAAIEPSPVMGGAARKARAKALIHSGRAAEALPVLERVYAETPSSEIAGLWLAAAESTNDPAAAVRAYEAFAQAAPPTAEVLVNWGRAAEAAGDGDAAIQAYTRAIDLAPDYANAYFNLGDLLYRIGHYEDACGIYELGLRRRPDFAQGWFVLGNSLAQLGIVSAAEIAYRRTLDLDPTHEAAQSNLQLVAA